MLASAKLCLSSQLRRARKLLQKLNCSRTTQMQGSSDDVRWFPSMELSTQLKQVFKLIDTNGDGKLSPSELKQVLLSLGRNNHGDEAEEEAKGIVREMDFDGDGFVDLDEFLTTVMTKDEDSPMESEIMEAFRVFDEDDDGLISAKELQRVLGRVNYNGTKKKKKKKKMKKYSVGECRKMIRGVDRDGDGFVNFEEFKFMMSVRS